MRGPFLRLFSLDFDGPLYIVLLVRGHPDPKIGRYSRGEIENLVAGGLSFIEREAPEVAALCRGDRLLLAKFPPDML